jgi:hypothetical protein
MIDRSEAPAIAALVACPARKLCPAYFAASIPALCANFFTTRAPSIPDSRPAEALAENTYLGHVRHARLRASQSAEVVEMRGLILSVIRA